MTTDDKNNPADDEDQGDESILDVSAAKTAKELTSKGASNSENKTEEPTSKGRPKKVAGSKSSAPRQRVPKRPPLKKADSESREIQNVEDTAKSKTNKSGVSGLKDISPTTSSTTAIDDLNADDEKGGQTENSPSEKNESATPSLEDSENINGESISESESESDVTQSDSDLPDENEAIDVVKKIKRPKDTPKRRSFSIRFLLFLVAIAIVVVVVAASLVTVAAPNHTITTLRSVRAFAKTAVGTLPNVPSSYFSPPPATATQLQNPGAFILQGRDAPDGFIYLYKGTYYLFSSQGTATPNNIPVVSGKKIGEWGKVTDAIPHLPIWTHPGFTWAPDVRKFGHQFVLYYTTDVKGTTPAQECIGEGFSKNITGPYTGVKIPLICQYNHHGSIDPRTFEAADGTIYMVWKSDDNAAASSSTLTGIYVQRMSKNGLSLLGQPTKIFQPDRAWQGTIVEAPQIEYVMGTYWLFYSGGWFNQTGYGIGVAKCSSILGPCSDFYTGPIVSTNAQGQGPGEESLFNAPTGIFMLYAPWKSNDPTQTSPRPVVMVRMGFTSTGGPYVASPAYQGSVGGPPATKVGVLTTTVTEHEFPIVQQIP